MVLRRTFLPWNAGSGKGTLYPPISLFWQWKFWQSLDGRIRVSEASLLMNKKLLQYADNTTATPSDLNSARAFFDLLGQYF